MNYTIGKCFILLLTVICVSKFSQVLGFDAGKVANEACGDLAGILTTQCKDAVLNVFNSTSTHKLDCVKQEKECTTTVKECELTVTCTGPGLSDLVARKVVKRLGKLAADCVGSNKSPKLPLGVCELQFKKV